MLVLGIFFLLLSGAYAQAVQSLGKTALVIAASSSGTNEAVYSLNQFNLPSQVLVMTQNTSLPALETTSGSTTVGNFGLIVIISLATYDSGGGNWVSAITFNQWIILNAYQLKYGVRIIHLDSYPGNFIGTGVPSYPAGCCTSGEQQVYLLNSTLVPGGGKIANYSTVGLWHYPAVITDYSTTSPFLAFAPNSQYKSQTVAGVIQNFSGRMQMVIFLTGATWSTTTNYLGQVWISWGYGSLLNQTSPHAGTTLLLAASASAADEAISTLNGYGQAYQLLVIPQNGTALPTMSTTNAVNQPVGNFGLIIIFSMVSYNYGASGWASAITSAQWTQLYAYQAQFGVGMIHLDSYPGNFPGMTIAPGPGGCCSSEDQYVYPVNTALVAAAGLTVTNLTTVGLWHYPALITDSTSTTPFIQFAPNNEYPNTTVAGVIQNLSDRKQMVLFIMGGSWSSTTNYIGKLWYTWGYQGQTGSTTTAATSSTVVASSTTSAPHATGTAVTEFSPYQALTSYTKSFMQMWTGYGCILTPPATTHDSGIYPGQELEVALTNCSTVCFGTQP